MKTLMIILLTVFVSFNCYSKNGQNRNAEKILCTVDNSDIKCTKNQRPGSMPVEENKFYITVKGKRIIFNQKSIDHIQLRDGTEIDIPTILEAVRRGDSGTHGGG